MVQQQALVQRRDADRQACLAGEEGRPAVDFLGAQLQSGQQLQQDFPASGRFGAEQYAAGELLDEPAQRGQRLGGLGFDRQVRQRQGRKRSRPTPGSTSSWLATTRGQFFSRAKQSSTGRNTSAGGSNGRSGSTRRSS